MKKSFLILTGLLFGSSLFSAPVWKEDFSKGATMEENGYRKEVDDPNDKVELRSGEMIFTCAKGKGTKFVKQIPFVRKGELSFEAKFNANKSQKFNHLSFQIRLYGGPLIYANGGAKAVFRYNPNTRNDARLVPIVNNEWNQYMIRFDMEKKTVEYYVNDFSEPVLVDNDFRFDPKVATNPLLLIGNYGNAAGEIVNHIRNLKLKNLSSVDPNAPRVIWKEDFSKGATMEENGYHRSVNHPDDKIEICDGELIFTGVHAPYNGTRFEKRIPFLKRGELSFDVKVNAEKSPQYNYLSLMVRLYDCLLICPNGGTKTLQRYHPGKQNNANIVKFSNNEWYHVAIRFDLEKKTIAYYVDDMENPRFVDEDFPFHPKAYSKSMFMIGNYGLASGTVVNCIKNIELRTFGNESGNDSKAEKTSGILILNGYSSECYKLNEFFEKNVGEKEQIFFLNADNLQDIPINKLQFDQMPGINQKVPPRLIILCDIPAGKVLPSFVAEQIEKAVKKGSSLLLLGGYFTLNKGEFKGSVLERIIPVVCRNPFDTKFFAAPVPVENIPDATVKAIQLVNLKSEAEVVSSVQGIPFVITGNYGHGKVVVVTGLPNDKEGDFAGSGEWTASIRKLLTNII